MKEMIEGDMQLAIEEKLIKEGKKSELHECTCTHCHKMIAKEDSHCNNCDGMSTPDEDK